MGLGNNMKTSVMSVRTTCLVSAVVLGALCALPTASSAAVFTYTQGSASDIVPSFSFTTSLTGAALDETAGYAKGPSAAEPVSNETIAANFKHLAAAAPYFQPEHFQATFESGLEMLLEGIRRAHGAGDLAAAGKGD